MFASQTSSPNSRLENPESPRHDPRECWPLSSTLQCFCSYSLCIQSLPISIVLPLKFPLSLFLPLFPNTPHTLLLYVHHYFFVPHYSYLSHLNALVNPFFCNSVPSPPDILPDISPPPPVPLSHSQDSSPATSLTAISTCISCWLFHNSFFASFPQTIFLLLPQPHTPFHSIVLYP